MALESIFRFAGFGTEIVLVALVFSKGLYKSFPIFSAYLAWDLFDNLVLYAVSVRHPASYFYVFLIALAVDSAFELAVLIELAWSVLRPFRSALPRGAIVGVAVLTGALFAVVWPFAHSAAYAHYGPQSRLLLHLEQTIAMMRVLFFLVLAGCSHLLSINWRDRELQIATGLGFYSLASLVVSILHAGQTVGPFYYLLENLVMTCNICCLLYWLVSFAKQAAPRREFTPQMQSFLLAMAGTARSARVAITAPGNTRLQDRDK